MDSDTRQSYEKFQIDPTPGLGADYLAWASKRTQSLTKEMKLGAVHGKIYAEGHPIGKKYATETERWDVGHENKGWYRTVRAAAICHCNPIWLAFCCHCGLIPHDKTRPTDFYLDMYRVKLEDVRAWMATTEEQRRR
jgi:hypothetical protein